MEPEPKVNILLVDDQPENLLALEAILQELGQNLFKAASGREALKLLLTHDFAAVLLDVVMPEMDGFETAGLIRHRDKSRHTPILFLTAAYKGEEYAFRGYTTGAVDYIVKPVIPEILRSKVSVFVELKRKSDLIQRQLDELRRAEEAKKRADAELLQAQKLQVVGQLSAGIAHEINNPVGYILSNLNSLNARFKEFLGIIDVARELAEHPADERTRERFRRVCGEAGLDEILNDMGAAIEESRHGGERIRDIVRSLGRFSHVDEGDLEPADLNKILDDSLRICGNELKFKATIHRDFGALPPVICYPRRLGQVFVNLLLNAGQAIEETGEIRLTTEAEGDRVVVRVRDTGCGIAPEYRERIFEPFFTTKPVGSGTGLGLHVARKIVEMHGGAIGVRSEPGKGAEFTVRLPKGGLASPPDRLTDANLPKVELKRRHTVVCVDDETPVLSALRRLLRREPYEVLATTDPAQVLEWARTRPIDLIVADQRMPKMLGAVLLDEARRIAPRVARILLTGYTIENGSFGGGESGGPWIIGKPWDDEYLLRAIRTLLGRLEQTTDSTEGTDSTDSSRDSGSVKSVESV